MHPEVSIPKVSGLRAEVFVHGIQGAHATVFLQPDAVREEIFTWSFRGGSQQRTHHHWKKKEHAPHIRRNAGFT